MGYTWTTRCDTYVRLSNKRVAGILNSSRKISARRNVAFDSGSHGGAGQDHLHPSFLELPEVVQ